MLAILDDVALATVAESDDAKTPQAIVPKDFAVLPDGAVELFDAGNVDRSNGHFPTPAFRFKTATWSPHGKHGKQTVSEIRNSREIASDQGETKAPIFALFFPILDMP